MKRFQTLGDYLLTARPEGSAGAAVIATIEAVADALLQIGDLVALGPLFGKLDTAGGGDGADRPRATMELAAHEVLAEALAGAPVAALISGQDAGIRPMRAGAPLLVAAAALEGSSNIEADAPVGTIFSIIPVVPEATAGEGTIVPPGASQLAAAYCIYGPQTLLVLTLGRGTQMFTLDTAVRQFRLTAPDVRITGAAREFAINLSNSRHWDPHIRGYINDCLAGEEGPRGCNYNMRWFGSVAADAHRIFARGGVCLYPGDQRRGFSRGRLHLVYECNPIAFLVEQAGGRATTGTQRILDVVPTAIHQHVPMAFGSREEISMVERYYTDSDLNGVRSQLFNRRSLLRA